jgi:hypothetical protein
MRGKPDRSNETDSSRKGSTAALPVSVRNDLSAKPPLTLTTAAAKAGVGGGPATMFCGTWRDSDS